MHVPYPTWFTSLTLDTIDIDATLSEVERLLKEGTTISPALKSLVSILVVSIKLLTNRVGLNSRNSSKPPSSDINLKKQDRKKSQKRAVVNWVMSARR
ncbi:MAG: transposase [Lentisphaeria bacterium]|jgi:transposase